MEGVFVADRHAEVTRLFEFAAGILASNDEGRLLADRPSHLGAECSEPFDCLVTGHRRESAGQDDGAALDLERVVGGPIDPGPYLRYLGTKLATLA